MLLGMSIHCIQDNPGLLEMDKDDTSTQPKNDDRDTSPSR